jgi:transcriptional regulator with XRE-family HTH domain
VPASSPGAIGDAAIKARRRPAGLSRRRLGREMAVSPAAVRSWENGTSRCSHYGCKGNLALLRRAAGDPAKARILNEEGLAGLEVRLGRDHRYSLTVAINLASDLYDLPATRGRNEPLRADARPDHPDALAAAAGRRLDFDFDSRPL